MVAAASGGPLTDLRVVPDAAALHAAAAEIVVAAARASVARHGAFHWVLSGGSTPRGLFERLATEPSLRDAIPWSACHVWWGDERVVPPDHADSNYGMARAALLARIPIPEDQIHRIRGEAPDPSDAAAEYEETLRSAAPSGPDGWPVFDLVLLGMGPDGHTASLFPGTVALAETRRPVVAHWVGKLDADRITLTAPAFNAARQVVLLVAGADKAPALRGVLEGPFEPQQLPVQLIHPEPGTLTWLVDAAAAARLTVRRSGTAGALPGT